LVRQRVFYLPKCPQNSGAYWRHYLEGTKGSGSGDKLPKALLRRRRSRLRSA
jgi:hypothetical protein